MSDITIDTAQLQALLDTVKFQSEALERSKRSEAERLREDAARQESRQRQHSLSIAADAEERNRGRAHQIEWDEAYSNLGRIAPAMREGETSETYRLRLASGVQNCSPEHKDLDLEAVLLRQPPAFRETILNQIRQDALRPEARHVEIPEGQIREFVHKDQGGRTVHEFASKNGFTFIHEIMNATVPRRIISRMFGVDRIGGPPRPVERPHNMGRMHLSNGLPR